MSLLVFWIWGLQSGDYEENCLLRFNAVQSCRMSQNTRRSVLLPSSGRKKSKLIMSDTQPCEVWGHSACSSLNLEAIGLSETSVNDQTACWSSSSPHHEGSVCFVLRRFLLSFCSTENVHTSLLSAMMKQWNAYRNIRIVKYLKYHHHHEITKL